MLGSRTVCALKDPPKKNGGTTTGALYIYTLKIKNCGLLLLVDSFPTF